MVTEMKKPTPQEIEALKEAATKILNDMVAHKIKGAEILLSTIKSGVDLVTESEKWFIDLKDLLIALQPFFEYGREFIIEICEHLVQVYDWAVEKFNELF